MNFGKKPTVVVFAPVEEFLVELMNMAFRDPDEARALGRPS